MIDEAGEIVHITGEMPASCPYIAWPNLLAHISSFEWDMAGKKSFGGNQDPLWNDHANIWQYKDF